MYISLSEILKNNLFQKAVILAGREGLEGMVKRVSVYDCPYRADILEKSKDIVMEGDFFITCLEQFKHESEREKTIDFLMSLIRNQCSGLLVVSEDSIDVITDKCLELANECDFPIILLKEEIPYAVIMDEINKHIAIDNFNAINALKLEKIMYDGKTNNEKMEVLYSINPNIKQYLRAIYVDGDFYSKISEVELHKLYLNNRNDIFVRGNNFMVFILSDDQVDQLKSNSDTVAGSLGGYVENPVLGFSRIYNRKDINKALEEGKRALETAKTMNMNRQMYDPLSSLQLLVVVKDSDEAHDFYKSYVAAIKENVSADNLMETLLTMETYVANQGNFSKTAEIMNQHENTIRYRVNKVKQALAMEDDNIKFYETLAIAVKLRTLIGEKIQDKL